MSGIPTSCPFCTKRPLRDYWQPKFRIGDRVDISKYNLTFENGFMSQLTRNILEIVSISSRKPVKYTMKDEQNEIMFGKFVKESWSKLFNSRTVYKRVGLYCICTSISRQLTQLFYKLYTGATDSGRSMGGREDAISDLSYPSKNQNVTEGKLRFLIKNFQIRLVFTI